MQNSYVGKSYFEKIVLIEMNVILIERHRKVSFEFPTNKSELLITLSGRSPHRNNIVFLRKFMILDFIALILPKLGQAKKFIREHVKLYKTRRFGEKMMTVSIL